LVSSGLFPAGLQANILYPSLMFAMYPAHLIYLDLIITVMEAFHYGTFSDFLSLPLSILLSILFLSTLNLFSFLQFQICVE
jgi:hypothetical protein